jgi:hypothetical protein
MLTRLFIVVLDQHFLQDNWQPALEKLVGSIGEKFSAAFDREVYLNLVSL